MPDRPKRWMVLGASPSAEKYHSVPEADAVAAAGASILIHRPDFYFVNEVGSLWKYTEELDEARRLGTKVILSRKLRNYLSNNKPPSYRYPCDEFLDTKECNDEEPAREWELGSYVPICGGVLALQWALNHGASEIHLVGMEGYGGPEDVIYFNGGYGTNHSENYTKNIYAPLLRTIVSGMPDVCFVIYGTPVYDLVGSNVDLAPLS